MKNLYQVLLVEKQNQMIHVYKNMLPWEDYGFQIASITDNEDKALAYFGEYKHDLVFTSIDLKSGNGISLIRQIKHLDAATKVVVISTHEDYDTVRDAFMTGADDYLLKSRLRFSSLATVLQAVKQELDGKQNADNQNDWETRLEKFLGLMRDQQKVDVKAIKELLQRKEFSLLQGSYRMLYIRMDNVRIFNRNMKQYDKPAWMSADEFIRMFQNKLVLRDEIQIKLKQIIEDEFQDIPAIRVVLTKKHSALLIVPPIEKMILQEKALLLIRRLYEVLTYEFSITISSVGEGRDTFLSLYQQVMEYHNHKFYDGDGCLEDADIVKEYHHLIEHDVTDSERIIHDIDMQQYEQLVPIGKHTITYMKEHYIEPQEVKDYFCKMISDIENLLRHKEFSEMYPFDVLRQGIQESESIMYLDLEFEKIVKTLIDWIQEHHISRYKGKVTTMIRYIQEHIHMKITIDGLAHAVGLSEIHASRIFKQETGKSIIAFVNEMKMKKAEELMKDDTLKIKEIANMVGMHDQLYFNKVFKKYYQMGPREYRKKLM